MADSLAEKSGGRKRGNDQYTSTSIAARVAAMQAIYEAAREHKWVKVS